MPKIGTTVLKLLLLITMVVEPVLLSYAMAGVMHHQGGAVMAMETGADQGAMSHDMKGCDSATQQGQHDGDGGHDNCCSTPACGAAVLLDFVLPATDIASHYFASCDSAWEGVILPSATKPPRSLRG